MLRARSLLYVAGVGVLCASAAWCVLPSDSPATPAPPARTPAHAPAEPRLTVELDGRSLGTIAVRLAGQTEGVALEPLARALGWSWTATTAGAVVEHDGVRRALRVGSRFIVDDGTERAFFSRPLVTRDGTLVAPYDDVARLFGLTVAHRGATLAFASAKVESGAVRIVEVQRTPPPRGAATPRPRPSVTPTPEPLAAFAGDTGAIAITLQRDGASSLLQAALRGQGATLRGTISSSGTQSLGTPMGTVMVGPRDRHASLGASVDPLTGVVMRSGFFDGVDLYRGGAGHGLDLVAGRRGDGRVLLALGRVSGAASTTVALVGRNGRYDQAVVRRTITRRAPWGEVAVEGLAGTRGGAAGIEARTTGKTYVQATASVTTPGMPLGQGDAPTSLSVNRPVGNATTVSLGMYRALGVPFSPFAGASLRVANVALTGSVSPHLGTAALTYAGAAGEGALFVQRGASNVLGGSATLHAGRTAIAFDASSQSGTTTASLVARGTRPGINLEAGVGTRGARLRPIAGATVPVARHLALEAAIAPGTTSGRSALRFSLLAGIPARAVRMPTSPLTFAVAGGADAGALRAVIDGVPGRPFRGNGVTLPVARGHHDVFVESVDGAVGSASHPIDLQAPQTLDLVLWPERAVRGRLRIDAPLSAVGVDVSLAGIAVRVVPGDAVGISDAEGMFVIPRQPLDPAALLEVDAGTLPRGLHAPEPLALGSVDGELVLRLRPAQAVERHTF